ncbi:hypothetical protein Zmor_005125 [Zophobas morio]|uniref:HEAT repeat-containing protein 1 n=1 Tax=Zophobas morio TaxID=2755281 RepID=A0AA38IVF1_9CUCU|nr:hypothetical protein Zmor_005125 [Zophobas morio]
MATSLSEQLKRLALPQTALLQRDKKKPSLLFEPKEAAGLKRETVYQIGLDGLEELITKDQSFEQFKNTLFHISSKKFERAVETAESNKKLDKVIRKFLLQLSPYFLLNCSHKALEWLINRYYIHEYNREELLMTIMPYHESNIFVRVIQLMKFKDQNDSWFFLKSLQKSGVHLTKQSLLTHAASDVYFLKFVGKFITLLIKQFEKPSLLTVAFNFYCAVYAGAIEYSAELNEAQITQMLPALLRGLNSDIPDYCAASYIILGRLVLKTPLTDVILNKFVEKVADAKVENLKTETVLVLLVLYQSQPHYNGVPEEACGSLVGKEWLAKVLQELSKEKYHVAPFLKALVKGCVYGGVKMDQEGHREFLKKLLAAVKFDNEFVETFLSLLLDNTKSKKQYPDHIKKWLTDIITTIERQYPDQFDNQVYKILSTTLQGKFIKRRQSLQKILKETMTVRCKFDVLDKLYHPNPTFRREAIRYLTSNYNSLRDREKEMIKSSFVDRLNDDDVTVVAETLALIKNISVLKVDALKGVLTKLTYKCQQDLKTWGSVSTEVVLMLCANSDPNDWETFVAVFPYLLPQNEEQLEAARGITQVSFVRKNSLLRKINGKLEECEKFCNNVFDSLRNDSIEVVESFVESLKQTPMEERSVLNKYLVTLILSCILPNNSSIETNVEIVAIFVKCLEGCEIRYEKGNALFYKHVAVARAGRFHIEAFLLCLKNVIVKTKKPDIDLGRVDFHEDSAFSRYFITLADALFRNSPNHKKYCLFFVNYFCKSLRSKLEFTLNLVSCGRCASAELPSECVDLIVRLLEPSVKDSKCSLLTDGEILLPFVLAMLLHESETIKTKMFKVVELLTQLEKHGYQYLFRELLNQREEIITDNDQLSLILYNYLSRVKNDEVVTNTEIAKTLLVKASCKKNYPVYLKAKTLELLSHINTVDIFQDVAEECLNLLKTESTRLDETQSAVILRNIMRCQPDLAPEIRLDSSIWKFIQSCVKKDNLILTINDKNKFAAILLLEQITKDFFASLTDEVQLKLLDLVVEVATVTRNPEILPSVRHLIKIIDLDSKLILPHFTTLRDVQSSKLDPNKLKRRISVVPTTDILDTLEWRKGLTALEFIQDKKKIRNIDVLLPVLFEVLKKCLDFDEQAAVEYPKQLILTQFSIWVTEWILRIYLKLCSTWS